MSELYAGLISGTSLDGVDAALVEFDASGASLRASLNLPYPQDLEQDLRRAAEPSCQLSAEAFGELDARVGEHFAQAALTLIRDAGVQPGAVSAIGSHGQTVAHDADTSHRYSVQLGDPNRIVERTGITTVADFRRRDLAAGGHGAPLMPGFHEYSLRRDGRDTAVLNLGGIANLTLLPADPDRPVTGFDTGPASCLLDGWARTHLDQAFDRDGRFAASGEVLESLLTALLDDPYFRKAPPKSTGTQYFNQDWLARVLGRETPRPEDVAATLVELTATTVGDALALAGFRPSIVLCCGGGARNVHLMQRLGAKLPEVKLDTTELEGIPPEWMEAMGFAWLARETLAGRPGNRHTVTGAAGPRILGAIYPDN